MKHCLILMLASCLSLLSLAQGGSVGIGTANPNNSAALDVQSTDKGMLIPRMTAAQRNAISNAATGLLVFDNTTGSFWFKNANGWSELVDTANSVWKKTGYNDNVRYAGTGNVGIGISNASSKLAVDGNLSLHNGLLANAPAYGILRRWDDNLNINAAVGNSIAGTSPKHLVLQIDQPLFPAGNVGIGTNFPAEKLDVNGNIHTTGKIQRSATGLANLVPICYGTVAANGTIISGTSNFSVLKDALSFKYHIDVSGVSVNPNTDVILVTPGGTFSDCYTDNPETPPFSSPLGDFKIVFSGLTIVADFSHFSFMIFKL